MIHKDFAFLEDLFEDIDDANVKVEAASALKRIRGAIGTGGQRIAILADVQNLYYATVRHGQRLNYGRLREYLANGRTIIRSIAFVVQKESAQTQEKFFDALRHMGWDVKAKLLQGDGKGDQDMELAIEALSLVNSVDTIVIVSGDSDFVKLVQKLKHMGKRVEIASFSAYTSNRLRRAADQYHSLDDAIGLVRAEPELVGA